MKICLIQPRWRIETDSLCDSLNLGYLASFMRAKEYRDISIYSAVFDSDKEIIENSSRNDVVGITATSSMMPHVYLLAKRIKIKNIKAKIVVGGVHASALPDETLRNENIDFVVRGEGEVSFYELIKTIDSGNSFDKVTGISYRQNGKIYHAGPRELIQNLDTIPFPARNLITQESSIRKYYRVWGKRCAAVLTSRGCPYNCSCCASNAVWMRKWRARSPENVIEELKQIISNYKVEEVHFEDANFAIDRKRIFDLCNLMLKEKLKLFWNCLIYPNTIDKELLISMKHAGCKTMGIGIESGSKIILDEYGKLNMDIEKVKDAFKAAKELNISTIAFFMLGLPSESRNTINQTKELLREIKPNFATCSILVPFPGTKYYQLAKEKGAISNNVDLSRLYYTRVYLPTNNLSKEELEKEYKKLLKEFDCFWRRRRFKFWAIYCKIRTELLNNSVYEYGFLFLRICKHLTLRILSPLYRILDL